MNQGKAKLLPVEPKIIAKLKLTNNSVNKYNEPILNVSHQSSLKKSLPIKEIKVKNPDRNRLTTIYQRLNENTYLRHSRTKT